MRAVLAVLALSTTAFALILWGILAAAQIGARIVEQVTP